MLRSIPGGPATRARGCCQCQPLAQASCPSQTPSLEVYTLNAECPWPMPCRSRAVDTHWHPARLGALQGEFW